MRVPELELDLEGNEVTPDQARREKAARRILKREGNGDHLDLGLIKTVAKALTPEEVEEALGEKTEDPEGFPA